jgi:death-on-curing protein
VTANQAWVWLDTAVLLCVHDEQLAEHGGAAGVRDEGLFESALARPRHLAHYGQPDLADLAACYGYGLARNHPFIDGNKRTAFVAVELFMELNGHSLRASDVDCVLSMLAVASGKWEEADLADWVRRHTQSA